MTLSKTPSSAEPVRARTVREFTRAFEPCGFQPDAFGSLLSWDASAATYSAPGSPRMHPTRSRNPFANATSARERQA
jgi:hypothetical protein